MGRAKVQRTEQLKQAAKRRVIADEVSNRIEQHNFDRLVAQGMIIEGGGLNKVEDPQRAGGC